MNDLVFVENNRVLTDSLTIAEKFNKAHKEVLRDIDAQLLKINEANEGVWGLSNFAQTQYKHPQNKQFYRKYLLTEEAFVVVAMSYVTKEAMKMKIQFIQAFNELKQIVSKSALPQNQLESRIDSLESKLENQMTIDYGKQRKLQRAIGARVYRITEDKKQRSKYFRELYREIRDRFACTSYKDVRQSDFQDALVYVKGWTPKREY
ncbi:Rha family transcriptional regulator [Listeria aquatica]|uniref:Rha family transcriptional regulator n=1 Tax=Listeria aquatica TaxID=1494960 RepID=A0A841ZMQ7_9LIST|nr:Rha family transcriptional regulator [Listeria aquatica]MBC1521433.1 Rha family transcriptional regulator [Listeria aquatica]